MFTTTKKCVDGREVILVYGPSSVGKTKLIETLPDLSRVCIINADNGLKTLLRTKEEIPVYDLLRKQKRDPKDKDKYLYKKNGDPILEIIPPKDRFPKLINFLKVHAMKEDFQDGFDWLVFDDATEMLNMLFDYLSELPEFNGPDKDKMMLKLWLNYDRKGTQFMKSLRDFAPFNILVLALSCYDKDADTSKRFIGVNAPGTKLPQRIPSLFDEVFYMDFVKDNKGNEFRKLITQTHKTAIAKDRSGVLEKFEDPDLTKILNKMKLDNKKDECIFEKEIKKNEKRSNKTKTSSKKSSK